MPLAGRVPLRNSFPPPRPGSHQPAVRHRYAAQRHFTERKNSISLGGTYRGQTAISEQVDLSPTVLRLSLWSTGFAFGGTPAQRIVHCYGLPSDGLHELGNRQRLARCHQQMDMVSHQNVGMYLAVVPLSRLSQAIE
jgi:hypothetical protein